MTLIKHKPVYFHDGQIDLAFSPQKIKVFVCGRAWGKSQGIGLITYDWAKKSPRAKIFLCSTTLDQIKNNTLSPIQDAWSSLGLIEDIHYVVCKRPPKGWDKPLKAVNKYDNVITFSNGFTIVLVTTQLLNSRRGGSYDAGIIDEAAFVKAKVFNQILKASIRGNVGRFDKDWHHSCVLLSSRPRTPEGEYLYAFKKMQDENPTYVKYVEQSAWANADVLSDEWFEDQKASMDEVDYRIEILNKGTDEFARGSYYSSWSDIRNTYTPQRDQSGSAMDINTRDILNLSWDCSGAFSGVQVWQQQGNTERCVREYWRGRRQGTYRQVLADFIKGHKGHDNKYVRLYGDPSLFNHDSREEGTIFGNIQAELEANGWIVEIKADRHYKKLSHQTRCEFMREALEHSNLSLPKIEFNKHDCDASIKSITNCDVQNNYDKDKKREKDPEYPQHLAPHLSDAFDYYYYVKHRSKVGNDFNGQPGYIDFI